MNDVTADSVAVLLAAGDTAGLSRLQAELAESLFAAWGATVHRAGAMAVVDVPAGLCDCDGSGTGIVSVRRQYSAGAGVAHAGVLIPAGGLQVRADE